MRTTVDLPREVHRRASAVARERRQSLSKTLAELVEQALSRQPDAGTVFVVDEATGLPVVRLSRTLTSEDVRALDDD